MMAQSKETFFSDLIDDYYAECDEHLASIRRALLAIEPALDRQPVDRRPLDELFRSFHTIKGLSGMVGLREAEQLAHSVEAFLRALLKGSTPLTSEGMDELLAATRLLEEVIAAHRSKKPMPDLAPLLATLEQRAAALTPKSNITSKDALAPPPSRPTLHVETVDRLKEALEQGAGLWEFQFTPSPSLAERGITVNLIRSRLLEIGEIMSAVPEMTSGEGIKFVFVVASFKDESSIAALRQEGLTCEPYAFSGRAEEETGKSYEAPLEAPPEHAEESIERSAVERPLRSLTPPHVIRVDLSRLDQLIQTLTSLVISRSHLEHNLQHCESLLPSSSWRQLQDAGTAMERHLRELREGIMGLRMVPIRDIFERMRFAVHDLCREQHKRVAVKTRGEETEIDKYVVEQMMDPLLHIVRNAISHGIEPEEERVAGGKPSEGILKLDASTSGDSVVIEVEDDGRGIDTELVLRKARSQGLADPAEGFSSEVLLDILCEAGFTTLARADVTSGRGVGMAIVKKTVQELNGTVSLDTRAGRGSRFTIRLPMTLAVVNALIVAVGGQTFAVPVSAVREIVEVDPADVTVFERNEVIKYRAGVLPLLRLARLFGLQERYTRVFYAIVAGTDSSSSGLAVDRLLGRREIVVRTLADPLTHVPGVSGATELGDGRAVLILDPAALVRSARRAGRLPIKREWRNG